MNRSTRGLLNFGIAATWMYVLIKSTLCPASGKGIIDLSLLNPSGSNCSDRYILAEIIYGTLLLILILRSSRIEPVAILVATYTTAVAIRADCASFVIGKYVAVIIVLTYIAFTMSLWCASKVWNYSLIFIITLLGILIVYGISSVRFLINHEGIYRLSIFFNHPNHLGNILAFGVVCLYPAATLSQRRWVSALMWAILALLTLGLIQTYSRGAWLGCAVGLTACIVYLCKRMSFSKLLVSLMLLVLIITGAVLVGSSVERVGDRIATSAPSEDASVGNRLAVWEGAVHMIRDHWLVGVGIGQFGKVLDRSYKPDSIRDERYESALNNYITLAAEAGIPTLIIYLAAVIYACITASKGLRKSGWSAGMQIGMLCGVHSMLVFGMTTYTLGRVYATVLVWSVLGYLIGQEANGQRQRQPS